MKPTPCSLLAAACLFACFLAVPPAGADDVRPERFGPYFQQSALLQGNPFGTSRVFPFGAYNIQAGWREPLAGRPSFLFRGTYLEAQGNATISPYQGDFGIAFNLKPVRFVEFGLAYNRLFYPNTLASFRRPEGAEAGWLPESSRWRPPEVLGGERLEAAGADIFTFQANGTVDAGPLRVHGGASWAMWDVHARARDVMLEYRTGLLVRRHDRIASLHAQALYLPGPGTALLGMTVDGWGIRDQLWWATQTGMSQNLVSVGVTGLRSGWNTRRIYRGVDGWVGLWTDHAQLADATLAERLHLGLQWTWNLQILNLAGP